MRLTHILGFWSGDDPGECVRRWLADFWLQAQEMANCHLNRLCLRFGYPEPTAEELDDLNQDLRIAMLTAAAAWWPRLATPPDVITARAMADAMYNRHRRSWRGAGGFTRRHATLSGCHDVAAPDETGLRENYSALRHAVEQLSADDQELIRLRYIEDLTLDAIGGRLGLSISTVHRRLNEALLQLKPAAERAGLALPAK